MTRKDYIALAEALAGVRPDPNELVSQFYAWEACRDAIARALSSDNYRFDRARFNDATEN
jgi:hypothetical protein